MASAASLLLLLLLGILCILCHRCHASRPQHFDVRAKCPHIHTPASLKTSPPPNGTLRIIVPWKMGFEQFVKFRPDSCLVDGFSVRVFLSALRHMRHIPHFQFVLFGDGDETPSYDDMIEMVYNQTVDAAVADLTITSERMKKVGFTQPYMPSSLVMLTPFRYASPGAFMDFLTPFPWKLWIVLLAFFSITGIELYFLENQNPDFHVKSNTRDERDDGTSRGGSFVVGQLPDHDSFAQPSSYPPQNRSVNQVSDSTTSPYQIPPFQENQNHLPANDISSFQNHVPVTYDPASLRRRLLNAYWFTSICVFKTQQGSVQTNLGRVVTGFWLFMMLIFNHSYTASLVSLLSQQKQYPSIKSFYTLQNNRNISVGCQDGSFLETYTDKLLLKKHTIKNLTSEIQYAEALRKGNLNPDGVGAIIDELPYIQVLLQLECGFTIGSNNNNQLHSFGGLGFAFRKGDPMIENISRIIVGMGEDGTLEVLKNGWKVAGSGKSCSPDDQPSYLTLMRFSGLVVITGVVYILCTIWRLSTKAVKDPEKIAILHTLPCIQCKSTINRPTREVTLSRRSNRICNESQQDVFP